MRVTRTSCFMTCIQAELEYTESHLTYIRQLGDTTFHNLPEIDVYTLNNASTVTTPFCAGVEIVCAGAYTVANVWLKELVYKIRDKMFVQCVVKASF